MTDLVKPIKNGKHWLDSFTRYSYREAFGNYRQLYLEFYRSLVEQSSHLDNLANEFVDDLESSWKEEKFWNRSSAKVNDKMVLICYLTPMLMEAGPNCSDFAMKICESWNLKWPNNKYRAANYETILKGFRHSIMGIDLESKHMDESEDF